MSRFVRPLAVLFAAVCALHPSSALAADPPPVSYIPPVDAPIIDPFRPPATPYGPGNRGLEYGTTPGMPVVASADGVVVFAGPVAGSLFVTILHADGLRTTYSYLASIAVHKGDVVEQGDLVGLTGLRPFFFSVRDGDTYLDPELLFAASPLHVWLVPEWGTGPSCVRVCVPA
jgi:murein DD-endopeptidase MepM/ murein hydrolase activator NlpD